METSTLPDTELECLPPDYHDDDNLHTSSTYLRDVERVKRDILNHTFDMSPVHVRVIKLLYQQRPTQEVADTLGISVTTVRRVRKSDKGRRLHALFMQLFFLENGASQGERKHLLWRMARKNEDQDARVAISAVSELNKMEHNAAMLEKGLGGAQQVEIVINNQTLPKGALD